MVLSEVVFSLRQSHGDSPIRVPPSNTFYLSQILFGVRSVSFFHGFRYQDVYHKSFRWTEENSAATRDSRALSPSSHARVWEGVAKSLFPRKAVVFKSGDRVRTRSIFVCPLEHSGVVGRQRAKVCFHPPPATRAPKPETRNPKPETRNPKSKSHNPEREILLQRWLPLRWPALVLWCFVLCIKPTS